MTNQPRAPTSKLLELIRTGSLPQDEQDTSDTEEDASPKERTQAAPIPAEPAEEIEKRDNIAISSGFYKVPNAVDDHIVAGLSMAEEVVYRHMIRLSWGWNRNWCRVGTNYFLQKSSLKSRKGVRDAIARLLKKKLIMHHMVGGRIDRNQDGTVYIVPLPEEIGVLPNSIPEDSILNSSTLQDSILSNSTPDKDLGNGDSGNGALANSTLQDSTLSHSTLHNSTLGIPSDSILPRNTPGRKRPGSPIQGGILQDSILRNSRITDNNTDRSKDTLSPRAIISGFYKGIGQQKITAAKRERAESNFKELLDDGFDPGDIQFAVEWTLKNAKEELYDFSIIKHTIGQAMAAKRKTQVEEAKKKEREKIVAQKEAEEKKVAEEEAQIRAYKESLSKKERAALRQRALEELENTKDLKKEFINDILIAVKENELLKLQMEQKEA